MAKLSISIPDELVHDLHAVAPENVSAFVAAAIRHELGRRRLVGFLDELDAELGPADEDEVAVFNEIFTTVAAAEASPARAPRSHKRNPARSGPAS